MKSNLLGSTDLIVSEIGLGCQSLGGGLHHGDKRAALTLVARALDLGISYFDTSDHYSLGASETLLGVGLKPVRSRVVISTKVGTYYTPVARTALRMRPLLKPLARLLRPLKHGLDHARSTQRRGNFSPAYVRSAVENSLSRLQTDYLDLLQLHKPPPELLRSPELLAEFDALHRAGKVRWFGVSCDTVADALQCVELPQVASLQVTINLLDRMAADTLLPRAVERRVGIIARNPRAAGLLAGGYGDITGETYASDSKVFAATREQAAQFAFLGTEGRTLAQAAIQFVLQLPGVVTTIPRALTGEQLEEFVGATALPPLSVADLARIHQTAGDWTRVNRKYPYRSAPGI